MSYILLPPALRATPLINAGGEALSIHVNNNLPRKKPRCAWQRGEGYAINLQWAAGR